MMKRISTLVFIALCMCFIQSAVLGQTEQKANEQEAKDQLIKLIMRGDIEAVKAAIDDGADVNKKGKSGFTPYEAARRTGFMQIAELLVSKGAKVDVPVPSAAELVEKVLSEKFNDATPACVVLIARDGKILMQKGFGRSDIEGKVSATVETKFRIGSVTKQFTAAAILKLEEEGKLSIEDKLSKYLPDFPRGDDVTLRHLLTHTSGIVSYTSKSDFWLKNGKAVTELEVIGMIENDPFDFEPGDKYSYCNTGYMMLGYIVGKVTDSSLEEYLKKEIFDPIGMKNTGIHRPDLDLSNEANGYSFEGDEFVVKNLKHMSWAAGAGAMYSTVGDLYLWNEALFSNKVLKKETLERAFKPTTLNDGSNSNYGYGWMIGGNRGLKSIEHGGGLPGFLTHLGRYPKTNTTIVVFVNSLQTGSLPPPAAVAKVGADSFLWQEMDERVVRLVDKKVDPKSYDDFIGEYDYGAATMDVTVEDGKLFAQLTGQSKAQIYPSAPGKFFWKIVDAEVEFQKGKDGKVIRAMHTQNGTTQNAAKLADSLKVAPEILAKYVGRYNYGAAVMNVTAERNKLFAQLTGQPKMRIYPTSDTKFEWHVVKADVEFVVGDDGKTIKVIHNQNGRKFDALKIEMPKPIEVTTEKLDEYLGAYNLGLFAGKMVITRVGDKMYGKLGSQGKLEIIPTATDEFSWLDVVATMKFVRGEDGRVIRGDFTQNGNTVKAKRVKDR